MLADEMFEYSMLVMSYLFGQETEPCNVLEGNVFSIFRISPWAAHSHYTRAPSIQKLRHIFAFVICSSKGSEVENPPSFTAAPPLLYIDYAGL